MQCGASAANCVLLDTWLGIGVAPSMKELSASATQRAGVETQRALSLAKYQLLFLFPPSLFFFFFSEPHVSDFHSLRSCSASIAARLWSVAALLFSSGMELQRTTSVELAQQLCSGVIRGPCGRVFLTGPLQICWRWALNLWLGFLFSVAETAVTQSLIQGRAAWGFRGYRNSPFL